jgi:GTPase SAR1 family protein
MKIGFCGTMSVGKTTLVNALKELPEFKNYNFRTERSKYLMEMGIPLNTDSTLMGQLVFASERAAELMQENIITDRTIIDVMAFCELSKSMSEAEKRHINGVLWHLIKEYDIIFHIDDLSVPIEDNGVRETNKDYRLAIHQKISSIIQMHKYMPGKVITISGNTKERINKIKESVNMYNI